MPLAPPARDALDSGDWIRLDVDGSALRTTEGTATTVLVGRAGGELRAFVNLCRHQAIPLDVAFDEWVDPNAPVVAAPLTDDGRFLICLRHGALYRLTDGMCIEGPCAGRRLFAFDVRDEGDALVLDDPPRVS